MRGSNNRLDPALHYLKAEALRVNSKTLQIHERCHDLHHDPAKILIAFVWHFTFTELPDHAALNNPRASQDYWRTYRISDHYRMRRQTR
jgi:hypothetical protein